MLIVLLEMAKNYVNLSPEDRKALLEKAKMIGWKLKVSRMQAGLKLGYMAHNLGISSGMLSGLENGARVWTLKRITDYKAILRKHTQPKPKGPNHARKNGRTARRRR